MEAELIFPQVTGWVRVGAGLRAAGERGDHGHDGLPLHGRAGT